MKGPIRALIADDEPLLRLDLAAELDRQWPGLEIEQAEDGLQALDALRTRPFQRTALGERPY